MNKDSVTNFRPEKGGMDKLRRVLEEEGIYMCKGDSGCDIYNFHGCTVLVDEKKITFGGELPVTRLYSSSQLEQKAEIKLEEIKENGN